MNLLQNEHSVEDLAAALETARSAVHGQTLKEQRPRRRQDKVIAEKLEESFLESRGTYGSPRLQRCLVAKGVRCGKNRIRRLMIERGLRPRQKRAFRPCTTQSDPTVWMWVPNWLAKVPTPDRPGQIWVADITYIPTEEGWLYLAVELDACSRRITGWAVRNDLATPLVSEAWERAIFANQPDPGLLHHSDRGSQYTSKDFSSRLRSAGACASMSRKGSPYDNAMAESFFATLKAECFAGYIPKTRAEARLMIFDFIDGFYNTHRLHSALDYQSPVQFERSFHSTNPTNTQT